MNSIASALSSGYSAKQIISYLSRVYPNLAPKIQQAHLAGYSIDKIMQFIGKGMPKGQSQEHRNMSLTDIELRNRQQNSAITKSAVATGASALGAGLGAYALSRAAPQAIQGIVQTGPFSKVAPQLAQTEQSLGLPGPQVNPAVSPQQPPNAPAPQPIKQPIQQAPLAHRNPQKSIELIKNLKEDTRIANLISGGMQPKDIAAFIKKVAPKEVSKALEAAENGIEGAIEDFAQSLQQKPNTMELSSQKLDEIEPIEGQKKIKAAMLPSGDFGAVESVKNGIAKFNVNGQIKHRKLDDILELDESPGELADLFDDLTSGIEKETGQQVSRNVEYAGYDPEKNELVYKPWQGSRVYSYHDISPDDVKELTSILAQRKTTGNNYIGGWEAGTRSIIGNRMYNLIQKLQKERGGKGNEYRARYETIYDATEPAKKASQERHKQRQKARQQQSKSSKAALHAKQNEEKKK